MGKGKAIAAIAVVAILVAGGAAAYMFISHDKDGSFSFDKKCFDLSGADSLAVIEGKDEPTANAVSVSIEKGGAVSFVRGDDQVEVKQTTFYKKTESGFVKVKLYTDESKSEEVEMEYSTLEMVVAENGLYAFMIFGDASDEHGDRYSDVSYVIVSLKTGKIYEIPYEDGNDKNWIRYDERASDFGIDADSPLRNYNDRPLVKFYFGAGYKYIGCTDTHILLAKHFSGNIGEVTLCACAEDGNELDFKEILDTKSSQLLSDPGVVTIYNGGIIRLFYNIGGSPDTMNSVLLTLDKHIKQVGKDAVTDCGGYICESVTYWDENGYFPRAVTRVVGINDDGTFRTETVNYTEEQSFDLAKTLVQKNEIYKNVDGSSIDVVQMVDVSHVKVVRLSFDSGADPKVSSSIQREGVVPSGFTLEVMAGTGYALLDDSTSGDKNFYTVINSHVCQVYKENYCNGSYSKFSVSTTVLSGGYMYKCDGNVLKRYDLLSGDSDSATLTTFSIVNSLDVDGDRAFINGVSTQLQSVNATVDFSTFPPGIHIETKEILREYRIAASN